MRHSLSWKIPKQYQPQQHVHTHRKQRNTHAHATRPNGQTKSPVLTRVSPAPMCVRMRAQMHTHTHEIVERAGCVAHRKPFERTHKPPQSGYTYAKQRSIKWSPHAPAQVNESDRVCAHARRRCVRVHVCVCERSVFYEPDRLLMRCMRCDRSHVYERCARTCFCSGVFVFVRVCVRSRAQHSTYRVWVSEQAMLVSSYTYLCFGSDRFDSARIVACV